MTLSKAKTKFYFQLTIDEKTVFFARSDTTVYLFNIDDGSFDPLEPMKYSQEHLTCGLIKNRY